MAAGRHFEIYKNLNNPQTVHRILTKFGMELRFGAAQTPEVSNRHFSKFKMAADEKLKFTKLYNLETVRPIYTKFCI